MMSYCPAVIFSVTWRLFLSFIGYMEECFRMVERRSSNGLFSDTLPAFVWWG
jgi:hypothetical protein